MALMAKEVRPSEKPQLYNINYLNQYIRRAARTDVNIKGELTKRG